MSSTVTDTENYAVDRSISNMIQFYKSALLSLLEGKIIVDEVPLGTRKRLVKHGIIRKFGSRFELTDLGEQLLHSMSD
ncbi:MAG TPA: hypothetical protein VM050_11605 [Patescibacteria group bacterium]|nr:hypothetical protein [Patescibacteria group bacterium]